MTILEYLTNPYGKGAAFGNVATQKQSYDEQFEKLQSKITHRIYLYRNRAIYHVVIPSQKEDSRNSYDVIIEIPFPEDTGSVVSLENRDITVFSNCPSFIFTYAHVFYSKGMLCKWLVDKYRMEVRRKLPIHTNQYNVIGFERSLYLAMKYLKVHGQLLSTTVRNSPIRPHNYNEIARLVRTQDQIMANAKSNIKIEKDKHLPPAKTTRGPGSISSKSGKNVPSTPSSSLVSKTKSTGKVKREAHTKRTKSTNKF